jgi:hypothetical protein
MTEKIFKNKYRKDVWDRDWEVVELYFQDWSIKHIADKMNCHTGVIKKILQDNGYTIKSRIYYRQLKAKNKILKNKDEIIRLYSEEKKTMVQICKLYKCHRITLKKLLNSEGIKIRGTNVKNEVEEPAFYYQEASPELNNLISVGEVS